MDATMKALPRYYSFHQYLKARFGKKVNKVSIDAGFTCPNIDGTKGVGGCTYCNNAGFSYNTRIGAASVREQLESGMRVMYKLFRARRYIAYFQAFSNTYAPLSELKDLYDTAFEPREVVGLAVGTRPDCVSPKVLDLLDSYNSRGEVWIEYGLQSSHDRTLERINRCSTYAEFVRAVEMTASRSVKVCVHLILGLPGETLDDMLITADRVKALPIHSIKLHNLHIMRDTPMAEEYARGEVDVIERDAYIDAMVRIMERMRPDISLQRTSGDAPPDILIAPAWCADKHHLYVDFQRELKRRDTWQGKALGFPRQQVGVDPALELFTPLAVPA